MMLFECPFCGPRPESEFHFGGDFGNDRPVGHEAVSDETWAHYLYFKHNRRGETEEIWKHVTCQETFVMRRDTLRHTVLETRSLRKGDGR